MTSEPVISVKNLGKCYQLYGQPSDRLKQFLWRGRRQYFREFWALRDVSFEVAKGEMLGIIGRNGAGKSTLLQLLCGTLTPTTGQVEVHGRIAALLELGSGFNPEFSGRENVYLSSYILGLSKQEIDERFEEIVEFSGIRDFIDQPVKTYSSGMYVRLAFSVATSVDPDILVVDEALSVGDGEFARKSFDRIMQLRKRGTTIVFCSHNLFQVDALCNYVLWLDHGKTYGLGPSTSILPTYGQFLDSPSDTTGKTIKLPTDSGDARIHGIWVNGQKCQTRLDLASANDDLTIRVEFHNRSDHPPPSLGVGIRTINDWLVCSMGSWVDGIALTCNDDGKGEIELIVPKIPLLKGEYLLDIYLMCERGLYVYDMARPCATLAVSQKNLEQGLVTLPRTWRVQQDKS
ncbi:MAG: ABC transporter ATP-binding protein [Methylococcales bacterium]|nr:ABC transporter ATP-binding protein [Methylococcales bacterium]